MFRYYIGFVAGLAAIPALLGAFYLSVTIAFPEHVPAPAITMSEHLDEKMRFLREHPELDPAIISVGSSITWRHVDGEAYKVAGEGAYMNGGTSYLKLHQTRWFLDFYRTKYPNIRTVLIQTALPDFEDCSTESEVLFDPEDVDGYAFKQRPAAIYYLKYFTPSSYLIRGWTAPRLHVPYLGFNWSDRFGSSPLHVPDSLLPGLGYKKLQYDPACAERLAETSAALAAEGLRLVIVFAPVHPEYRERYPESDARMQAFLSVLEPAIAGHGTRIVNLYDDPSFAPSDFWDAFHLQWPAVRRMSSRVAEVVLSVTELDGTRKPRNITHR